MSSSARGTRVDGQHRASGERSRRARATSPRGEAPLGIVYSTDATSEPNVKIVATFPADTHPPIVYPAALTKNSTNADAKTFLDFLRSGKARSAFETQGFSVLVRSNSST